MNGTDGAGQGRSSTPLPSPGGSLTSRFGSLAVLVVASLVFLGLGAHEAWSDAPTFDEPVYVAAGLAAVLHHDLEFNAEHPPLAKVVSVLPVLLVHPVVPANGHWDGNDERTYSARFVRAQLRAGTLRAVTFASRLVTLLEAVGLAFVLAALGRDLFGRGAGTLAGLLWLLSPLVLGLGHLNSVDLAFALAVGLWSWALLRWTRQPSTRQSVVLGLATGAAALCDVTGLLLGAVVVVTMVVFGRAQPWRRTAGQCALTALVAWAGIWALYAVLDPRVVLDPTVILPAPYLHGITYLSRTDTVPGPGYLLGVAWTGGRWWYWPGALLVKTVPTTLLLLVGGLFGLARVDGCTRRRAALVLGLPTLVLTGFTMTMPRDIGVRYLLPVVALWLVAASSIVRVAWGRWAGRVLLGMVVAVAGVATVVSAPGTLSWVAPPFGHPYQVATNSDVDWGQGWYQLEQWSTGRHPWVDYFGARGLDADQIPGARQLPVADPRGVTGWVAVSATNLTSAQQQPLTWLRAYCPVGQLGQTILLYRFAAPPVVAAGPSRPAGFCGPGADGAWSVRRG